MFQTSPEAKRPRDIASLTRDHFSQISRNKVVGHKVLEKNKRVKNILKNNSGMLGKVGKNWETLKKKIS